MKIFEAHRSVTVQECVMRYLTALSLAVGLGAAASAYTSAAAARVYVGVDIAPPVIAAPVPFVAPAVRVAPPRYPLPYYGYGPACWHGYGAHYFGPRGYWGGRFRGWHRR
jgi:hypothetical protein